MTLTVAWALRSPRANPHRGWRGQALVFLIPLWLLGALALLGPPTWETAAFFVAASVCLLGVLRRRWRVARVAAAVMLSLVVLRLGFADDPALSSTRGDDSSWLDRVVPERDLALGASRLLVWTGAVREPGLLAALEDGYDRMRDAQGWVPSPVLSNFLLPQEPSRHQTVRVAGQRRHAAVVFLHGSRCAQPATSRSTAPTLAWSTRDARTI